MNQIITKKELEEMISKNIDYDYEIFQKICDVVGKGKRKRGKGVRNLFWVSLYFFLLSLNQIFLKL